MQEWNWVQVVGYHLVEFYKMVLGGPVCSFFYKLDH